MAKFTVHNIQTAPERSKPALEKLAKSVGTIPNLAGTMAGSPTLIDGFATLRGIWQQGSFSPLEREVVSATNAVANNCEYCVAIHSTLAKKEGIDEADLALIRAGRSPNDRRLGALSDFARKMMAAKGQLSDKDLEEFLAAGFTNDQALEVVVGAAVSVLANYTNHLAHAPLDDFLKPQVWKAAA